MSKPTKKEYATFTKLLEKWDYYYFNQDSNTLYLKGKTQEDKLKELANSNKYLLDILKQFHIVQDVKGTAESRIALKHLEELKVLASS